MQTIKNFESVGEYPLTIRVLGSSAPLDILSKPFLYRQVIFKYMKKSRAIKLIQEGELKISTLYEFRNDLIYNNAVADTEEGKKTIFKEANIINGTQKDLPEIVQNGFNVTGKVNLPNTVFEREESSPNLFIFCASKKFSLTIMKQLGYDTCVKIIQPEEFLKDITECIYDKASYKGFSDCIYTSRRKPVTDKAAPHPALIKDARYSKQKEVRAVWQPKDTNIEPIIVRCNKLIKYCSLINND